VYFNIDQSYLVGNKETSICRQLVSPTFNRFAMGCSKKFLGDWCNL